MTLTYNRLHIYILKLTLLIIAAMLSACSDEIDYERAAPWPMTK